MVIFEVVQPCINWRMAAGNLTMQVLDAAYFTDRKKTQTRYAKLLCIYNIYDLFIYLFKSFGLSHSVYFCHSPPNQRLRKLREALGW